MDDIIKSEEEANEATQRGEMRDRAVKTGPVATQAQTMESSKPRSCISHTKKAVKVKSTPPPKPDPVKQIRPTPPVDEAMDSEEEEDILDLLSYPALQISPRRSQRGSIVASTSTTMAWAKCAGIP
ncbi:hypothetical protein ON010_g12422 [Phytophthora cinnamomi]|nr:hypothetical protein ON010_g12422 [Phytophthora cinnamomi]